MVHLPSLLLKAGLVVFFLAVQTAAVSHAAADRVSSEIECQTCFAAAQAVSMSASIAAPLPGPIPGGTRQQSSVSLPGNTYQDADPNRGPPDVQN